MDVLDKAIIFATEAHSEMFRKGTTIPYITHPLEVLTIIATMTNDKNVMAAGVLHDTVEDCKDITIDLIESRFGGYIAQLVSFESEDKSKTWKERKSATLEDLKFLPTEAKIIMLADKLSNIRATYREYCLIGDKVWDKFNEKRKSEQEWYYKGILNGLEELKDFVAYQEYRNLLEYIFK